MGSQIVPVLHPLDGELPREPIKRLTHIHTLLSKEELHPCCTTGAVGQTITHTPLWMDILCCVHTHTSSRAPTISLRTEETFCFVRTFILLFWGKIDIWPLKYFCDAN